MRFDQYRGATVVVTGHTGFKGAWLTAWLQQLGATVVGVALDPPSVPSHFVAANLARSMTDLRIDIRDGEALQGTIVAAKPDFVFHLAAQSLVRNSYQDPISTWQTNVIGTLNVLEALRKLSSPCHAVIITSDKCYDNVEWVWGYRETDETIIPSFGLEISSQLNPFLSNCNSCNAGIFLYKLFKFLTHSCIPLCGLCCSNSHCSSLS